MTQASTWKHGKYFQYKRDIQTLLPGYALPRELAIEFHLPLRKSYGKGKRAALAGQYHDQKPDLDNLCKAFMDAFGDDDKHVAILHAGKYWTDGAGYIVLP